MSANMIERETFDTLREGTDIEINVLRKQLAAERTDLERWREEAIRQTVAREQAERRVKRLEKRLKNLAGAREPDHG